MEAPQQLKQQNFFEHVCCAKKRETEAKMKNKGVAYGAVNFQYVCMYVCVCWSVYEYIELYMAIYQTYYVWLSSSSALPLARRLLITLRRDFDLLRFVAA